MGDVAMPRLSDSMEEGTILKWLKSDGDEVSKGEELVEIETDKANMTYEADEAGTLEIVAKEGHTLPVGETIARIGEGGGGSSDEEQSDEEEESREDADEEKDGSEESGDDEDSGDDEEAGEDDEDSDDDESDEDETGKAEADEGEDKPSED